MLDNRYICSVEDIVKLAGLQLQIIEGYDPLKHANGYLAKSDRWKYLVPEPKRKLLNQKAWIDKMMESWKSLKGITSQGAKNR